MEQYNPGWSDQWGEMVNHLIRDAHLITEKTLIFLSEVLVLLCHCWANGFATFQGNDQESSSESMQFNSSLIHWGSVTNNDEIRDLGIYLYTTEQTAIDEYWFDMYEGILHLTIHIVLFQEYGVIYDNGTF